ncbi:hypothetical protein FNF27_05412 [Cafeteria roenbergensis]|uniref:EF-hand domain-containing protein n=1 Tax=Cafeteria roenbergensis TaxID=33653 RepID=A0A5A8E5R0_CAFRO|nr:hypothetical protein FNF27_05412 [Cafeteria roenbergensis]
MGSAASVQQGGTPGSDAQTRRQALAQTVRDAFSKWQLASVWSAFERAFVLLEATPSTSVSVNRFEFFNIFGYSRAVDEATGLPAEGGQFVTLPLFLFKVFAEAPSRALRSAVAHAGAPDEALLRANLYEMFMVLCMFARGDPRAKAAMLFRMFDLDGGGDLDADELCEFMHIASRALYRMGQVARRPSKRGVRKLAAAVLKTADTNGDGRVDWEEFFVWAQAAGTTKSLVKSMAEVAAEEERSGEGRDGEEPVAGEAEAARALAAKEGAGDASGAAAAEGGKPAASRRQRRWSVSLAGGLELDLEALGGAEAAAELARAASTLRVGQGAEAVPTEQAIQDYLSRLLAKADRKLAAGPAAERARAMAAATAAAIRGGTPVSGDGSPAVGASPLAGRSTPGVAFALGAGASPQLGPARSRRSSVSGSPAAQQQAPPTTKQQRLATANSFRADSRRFDSGRPPAEPAMTHGVVHGPEGAGFHADQFIGSLFHDDEPPAAAPSPAGARGPDGRAGPRPPLPHKASPAGLLGRTPGHTVAPEAGRPPPAAGAAAAEGKEGPLDADVIRVGDDDSLSTASSRPPSPPAQPAAAVSAVPGGTPGVAGGLSIRAPASVTSPLIGPAAAHGAESPLPLPIRGAASLQRPPAYSVGSTPLGVATPGRGASPGPSDTGRAGAPSPGTPGSVVSSTMSGLGPRQRVNSVGGGFVRDASSRLPPGARLSSLRQSPSPLRLSPLGRGMTPSASAGGLAGLAGLARLDDSAVSTPIGAARARGRVSLRGSASPDRAASTGGADTRREGTESLNRLLAEAATYSLPAIAAGAASAGFSPTRGQLGVMSRSSTPGGGGSGGAFATPPRRPHSRSGGAEASPAAQQAFGSGGDGGVERRSSPGQESQRFVSGVAHQPLLWGGQAPVAQGERRRTSSLSATVARARTESRVLADGK